MACKALSLVSSGSLAAAAVVVVVLSAAGTFSSRYNRNEELVLVSCWHWLFTRKIQPKEIRGSVYQRYRSQTEKSDLHHTRITWIRSPTTRTNKVCFWLFFMFEIK